MFTDVHFTEAALAFQDRRYETCLSGARRHAEKDGSFNHCLRRWSCPGKPRVWGTEGRLGKTWTMVLRVCGWLKVSGPQNIGVSQ